jgi:hypothetical protein
MPNFYVKIVFPGKRYPPHPAFDGMRHKIAARFFRRLPEEELREAALGMAALVAGYQAATGLAMDEIVSRIANPQVRGCAVDGVIAMDQLEKQLALASGSHRRN